MTDDELRAQVGTHMLEMLGRVDEELLESYQGAVDALLDHAAVLHESGFPDREIAGSLGSVAGHATAQWMRR